ncbi:hypothetical protein KRX52_06360 [Pseudomonas sp. MAP12]|uniref:Uncharacterized protein n=1 Tax=Geopseudomonas aromaticivorans TaxID=2849492 RepID=A0ABS6MUE5_9GAMM|nr:hypothetical protein [Pseudomonas aromaticivorans]MBV2132425.1 hypothetical protein [Pseudomonas aromaticivorans]
MHRFARILLLLVVVPAVYFFVYWLPFDFVPLEQREWVASLVALLCAVLAGRFLWIRTVGGAAARGLLAAMSSGALALGGIGFCAGFFGPLLLTPDANQGPLLGLFITGPLGFLLGGIGGFFYWLRHRDKPLS